LLFIIFLPYSIWLYCINSLLRL